MDDLAKLPPHRRPCIPTDFEPVRQGDETQMAQRAAPGARDPTRPTRDQEAGVEYEYRVTAVNRAGEGPASNIVRAVPLTRGRDRATIALVA